MKWLSKWFSFVKGKNVDLVAKLKVEKREAWRDSRGNTLLHLAIVNDDIDVFQMLPKTLYNVENALGVTPRLLTRLLKKDVFLPFFEEEDKLPFRLETSAKASILSHGEFEEEMGVKIFPTLYFQNERVLGWVIKKCRNALKKSKLEEEQIWYGHYFEEEINKGFLAPVKVKWIDSVKEFGLFNLNNLKKGQYVGEYGGLVRKRRKVEDDKNPYCFEYLVTLDRGTPYTIDAKACGNICRFINHSHSPNLAPVLAYASNVMHIIFVAARDIPALSELTYDYGPRYWSRREAPLV